MTITTSFPNSFKKELFEAAHNFLLSGGNTFKLALYTSSANLGPWSVAYGAGGSPVQEAASTSSPLGYVAGGNALTRIDPALSAGVGFVDFQDLVFSACTITARGCMIYNSSASNKAVYVGDFGADKTATAGTFTITMPAATSTTAILRIA
jgi:hypothetical protein